MINPSLPHDLQALHSKKCPFPVGGSGLALLCMQDLGSPVPSAVTGFLAARADSCMTEGYLPPEPAHQGALWSSMLPVP